MDYSIGRLLFRPIDPIPLLLRVYVCETDRERERGGGKREGESERGNVIEGFVGLLRQEPPILTH